MNSCAHNWFTYRGHRRCKRCALVEHQVAPGNWQPSMSLQEFAQRWLPTVSGTNPRDMLRVDVAYPFEWNCYESWNIVFRITFDFGDVVNRTANGLGSRVDVMHGWQSKYQEDFCQIHYEAEQFYTNTTGRALSIGDNAYDGMRRIIQHD